LRCTVFPFFGAPPNPLAYSCSTCVLPVPEKREVKDRFFLQKCAMCITLKFWDAQLTVGRAVVALVVGEVDGPGVVVAEF